MNTSLRETKERKKGMRKIRFEMWSYEIRRIVHQTLFGRMKQKRFLRAKTKEVLFVWGMLLLPLIDFAIFYVYKNASAITLAFRNIDHSAGGVEYWTLNNFVEVWDMFTKEDAAMDLAYAFGNTLKYFALGILWSFPHSILLTYVFYKKLRGTKFFRVVLYLPSIINSVVLAGVYESFISTNGAVGYILKELFKWERVPSWFREVEYATPSLLFYSFLFGFAGSYILFSGAIAQVSDEIAEAAYMDGVSMWQEIWYIDIPIMWPTISMTLVTTVAGVFGASGPILLFTHNVKETWTLAYWMYDQVRTYQSYYLPSALGLVFTLITFPVVMLIRKLLDNVYK